MSDPELPPLPPDVQELLRSAPRPAPPPGFGESVLNQIKGTIGSGGGGMGGPGEAGRLASKMGSWGLQMSIATLVLGAAAGLLAGAKLFAVPPQPAVPQIERQAAPIAAPRASEPQPIQPLSPEPRRETKPARAQASARDFDLSDERSLIEMARTALTRRETEKALQVLREHGQRFPKGQLLEERESLLVQALVNAGQLDDARARAAEFRRRFPESMLLPAVEAALSSVP
ncbi:MAG: hypothetical protein ACYC8T_28770 [Myxococcaceae bacterium]